MFSKSKGGSTAGGGGGGDLLDTNILYISSLADLPAPIGNNIMIPADSALIVDGLTVDLGINNLVMLGNTTIQGMVQSVSAFTSSHASGTIVNSGAFSLSITKMDLSNTNGTPIVYSMDNEFAIFLASDMRLFEDVNIGMFQFINYTRVQSFGTVTFSELAVNGIFLCGAANWFQLVARNSIVVVEGASVGQFVFGPSVNFSTDPGGIGILLENPDSVLRGTFDGVTLNRGLGGDNLLACNPVSTSSFAQGIFVEGLGFDGTNLISCINDFGIDLINLHDGVGVSVLTTISTPSGNIQSVVWARGNLISIDSDPSPPSLSGPGIYIHAGFTTTINDSFLSPDINPVGITYDGTNIISLDSVTGIHVHDELTNTVTENFASPAAGLSIDIAFDGVNIIVLGSDDTTYIMRGISEIVQYKFSIGATDTRGIVITDVGAVIVHGSGGTAVIFDHPITFDHSSVTWDIMNSSLETILSSDRGGSQYSGGNVPVSLTQDVWVDIADSGTLIFYGIFSAMEKCRLNNEQNGEIIWTGIRNRGRVLSAQVVVTRAGGAGDVTYEVVVVINGIIQMDGRGIGLLPTSNTFVTINTVPITKDLIIGDKIKVQIRNTFNGTAPEVSINKLSIN